MAFSIKKLRSKLKHFFGPVHFGVLLVTIPISLYYFGLVLSDLHSKNVSSNSQDLDQVALKSKLKDGSLETPWDGLEEEVPLKLEKPEESYVDEPTPKQLQEPESIEEKIPNDPVKLLVTKPKITYDFDGTVNKKLPVDEPVHLEDSVESNDPVTPANAVETSTVSKIRTTQQFYNLIEENYGPDWRNTFPIVRNCTVDHINRNQLQQDHPCVINAIQRGFLIKPALSKLPYNLDHPEVINQSDQSTLILQMLRYKTKGFFVECGANDGETLSSTLFMERFFKWKGLLIEPNPNSFFKLLSRNRKAYALPICLSPDPYPVLMTLNSTVKSEYLDKLTKDSFRSRDGVDYTAQCFPFYSVLLAINRNRIDFFRLSAFNGLEFQVLKTIPWDKVDITIISIGLKYIKEEELALTNYMKKIGYVKLGQMNDSDEVFYVKDKPLKSYR